MCPIRSRMEQLREQFDRSTPKDRQLRAALILEARRLYSDRPVYPDQVTRALCYLAEIPCPVSLPR